MERVSRGDIWTIELVAHPKPRPALVVSIDPINDLCPDVLLIPITTHPGPLRVPLPDQPETTGLRQPSFAKCESLGPIHKSRLKRRIGSLPAGSWAAVEEGVKRVLGLED
ncbi:MAG TPA: type II toxin-antitoxin system PemK/MazF family toxin [Thermoanaerobaculia bacterium]|nr:type II toxin-antitoxin system PemK/MazF family toxin [Thermoanaerobaculia bacterium]